MARYDGTADWYDTEFLGDLHDHGLGAGAPSSSVPDRAGSSTSGAAPAHTRRPSATGDGTSPAWMPQKTCSAAPATEASPSSKPMPPASLRGRELRRGGLDLDSHRHRRLRLRQCARSPGSSDRNGPFVYVGGHPCFVGPHALFRFGRGVPELHAGYRPARRYDDAEPGVFNPEGLRARVGASHLPLGELVSAFTSAGLRVERFEEDGEADYPYLVALVARR